MDFPNCPCWLLEFEHIPETETNRMSPTDIAQFLMWSHVAPDGKVVSVTEH